MLCQSLLRQKSAKQPMKLPSEQRRWHLQKLKLPGLRRRNLNENRQQDQWRSEGEAVTELATDAFMIQARCGSQTMVPRAAMVTDEQLDVIALHCWHQSLLQVKVCKAKTCNSVESDGGLFQVQLFAPESPLAAGAIHLCCEGIWTPSARIKTLVSCFAMGWQTTSINGLYCHA